MNYLNIFYHKPGLDEDINDASCLKHIGRVTVRNGHYTVSENGFVSFNIITDEPHWFSKIKIKYNQMKRNNSALIISTSDKIYAGDVFDIYSVIDPQLYGQFVYHYSQPENKNLSTVLYWKLVARQFNSNKIQVIDLLNKPHLCPVCGCKLYYTKQGMAYCNNYTCNIHKYRDISRYVNLACGIHGYDLLVKRLIDYGQLFSPDDLYYNFPREEIKTLGYWTNELENFFNAVDSTIGKVKLSDYLKCLPIDVDYCCVDTTGFNYPSGDYICPSQIDFDCNNAPDQFMDVLRNMFDLFYLTEDFTNWKEKSYYQLQRWMSIPVFFNMCDLLLEQDENTCMDDGVTYRDILINLDYYNVFARK